MTAVDRFKRLLADALERVCVLEEQLEAAQARTAELEAERDVELQELARVAP